MTPTPWHTLDAEQTLQRLHGSGEGLTTAEAQRRLLEQGPNALPEGRRRTLAAMIVGQFSDFMILVLLAAAVNYGDTLLNTLN
ncbi:MAG: hypothetical protein KJ558_12095 [Gammaproteobacteria bacterium]|nr:hypothetical protein [Gammaproteobacteria bacterium]MBU1655543.1 hypothetical protein [Gammaproteobacteria bacterium]MBU1961291.1 hypothetical protein [Gammaproteobacteria bacterium]